MRSVSTYQVSRIEHRLPHRARSVRIENDEVGVDSGQVGSDGSGCEREVPPVHIEVEVPFSTDETLLVQLTGLAVGRIGSGDHHDPRARAGRDGGDGGDDRRGRDPGGDGAERERPSSAAATQAGLLRTARRLGGLDLLALPERFVEELGFECREPHRGRGPPMLEDVETTAGEQVVGITASGQPLVDDERVGGVLAQVVAPVVDPSAQPLPLTEQRLMGDLHREGTREGIPVADQEPTGDEGFEGSVHGDDVDIERDQLGGGHDAAGLGVPADGDQPQEQLAGGVLLLGSQVLVDLLGTTGDRPTDPAQRLIRRPGERRVLPAIEQLGERVLEQRQGVRLPADLGDQFGQQTLLERDPDTPCRSRARRLPARRRPAA